METYARGIPTYKGENGQTIGLLCETKEQCITDDNGVRLSDKLQSMQKQIGTGPDFTGYATEEFVNNAVSDKATTAYVDAAVSNVDGGGDADTLDGHHASYFATTDIVTDIVNGTIQVGRTMIADRAITADVATSATQATTDGNGNNIAATYLPKSVVIITNIDPGVGAYVSYPNGTLLFVKGA